MNIFWILCAGFMVANFGLLGLLFSGALRENSKGEASCFIIQPICGCLSLVFLGFALWI